MTTVTISQPRYLPACNYIQRMLLSDVFVYLDNVKYSPRDWENRNKLKMTNGKSAWISVPVVHKSRDQLIKDTQISNHENWARKHLNMLIFNYGKSKYYDRYIEFFEAAYSRKWIYLVDLNIHIINFIVEQLGIKCKFIKASQLDVLGKGQMLLIDICKKVGGDVYISGPMGRNYIDEHVFRENNIQLFYHDYIHPVYPQLHGEFLSYMSVIDLLFNCGDESINFIQHNNMTKDRIKNLHTMNKHNGNRA